MSERREAVPESERTFYGPWVNDFLGSLRATGAFAEALRKGGYDPRHPATRYPVPVFLGLIELVRRQLFPDLPLREAQRQVGRLRFMSRIENGIGGKIWVRAFPLIGPERMIQGVEKFTSAGNNFILAEASKLGDKRWRIAFRHTGGVPGDFLAGSIECGLEWAKTPPGRKVVVSHVEDDAFDLELTW